MNTDHVHIEKVTYFVLHLIYNRPKREKSPGDATLCNAVCWKERKKKVCTYKITIARSKFRNYENIPCTFS